MKIKIVNTTDHKYIGNVIYYNGSIDDLYITNDTKIELIKVTRTGNDIIFISMNYIITGIIIEE